MNHRPYLVIFSRNLLQQFSCLPSDHHNDEENYVELIKMYAEKIDVDEKSAKGEFSVWKQQIKNSNPIGVIDAMHICIYIIFSTIHRQLVTFATFPVAKSASSAVPRVCEA